MPTTIGYIRSLAALVIRRGLRHGELREKKSWMGRGFAATSDEAQSLDPGGIAFLSPRGFPHVVCVCVCVHAVGTEGRIVPDITADYMSLGSIGRGSLRQPPG